MTTIQKYHNACIADLFLPPNMHLHHFSWTIILLPYIEYTYQELFLPYLENHITVLS